MEIARPKAKSVRAIESASCNVRPLTGEMADWACRAATFALVMTAPVTIAAMARTTTKIAYRWSHGFIDSDDFEVSHHAHVFMFQVVAVEHIASTITGESD